MDFKGISSSSENYKQKLQIIIKKLVAQYQLVVNQFPEMTGETDSKHACKFANFT